MKQKSTKVPTEAKSLWVFWVDPPKEPSTQATCRISSDLLRLVQIITNSPNTPWDTPAALYRSAINHMVSDVIGDMKSLGKRYQDDLTQYKQALSRAKRIRAIDNAMNLMGEYARNITMYTTTNNMELAAAEWLYLYRWFKRGYMGRLQQWALDQWNSRKDVEVARLYARANEDEVAALIEERNSEMDEKQDDE